VKIAMAGIQTRAYSARTLKSSWHGNIRSHVVPFWQSLKFCRIDEVYGSSPIKSFI